MPQLIAVGGFTIPQPPAAAPVAQAGIANLPHPTPALGETCAACHTGGIGGKGAIGYDHVSPLGYTNCGACHEAGSPLVGTTWNQASSQAAGLGDTRPYTLPSIVAPPPPASNGSPCTITLPNHFYPVDCSECHGVPAGTGATTTGAAYGAAWTFLHGAASMTNPSTCNLCHVGQDCRALP
jgi:hypothetical protein